MPVAWAVWEQNQPLPDGAYWQQVDRLLATAAALIPTDLPVVVTAGGISSATTDAPLTAVH